MTRVRATSPSTTPPGQPDAIDDAHVHDVLVVGGGPSGSACAYWLADAGWDVVLVEKKHFPREKTCGDGLTPRSVRQLEDMGLAGRPGRRPPLRRACGRAPTA